jgi:hypothetical protein
VASAEAGTKFSSRRGTAGTITRQATEGTKRRHPTASRGGRAAIDGDHFDTIINLITSVLVTTSGGLFVVVRLARRPNGLLADETAFDRREVVR